MGTTAWYLVQQIVNGFTHGFGYRAADALGQGITQLLTKMLKRIAKAIESGRQTMTGLPDPRRTRRHSVHPQGREVG